MSKSVFRFRIHTGQWDSDGEQCLLWIGGGLKPDGKDHAWLTTPNGKKVLRVERKNIQPLSVEEAAESVVSEAKLRANHKKAPHN